MRGVQRHFHDREQCGNEAESVLISRRNARMLLPERTAAQAALGSIEDPSH